MNALPDVAIERTSNGLQTSIHRNSTDIGLYLHYDSNKSLAAKKGVMKTLLLRAKNICSSPESFEVDNRQLPQQIQSTVDIRKI